MLLFGYGIGAVILGAASSGIAITVIAVGLLFLGAGDGFC